LASLTHRLSGQMVQEM